MCNTGPRTRNRISKFLWHLTWWLRLKKCLVFFPFQTFRPTVRPSAADRLRYGRITWPRSCDEEGRVSRPKYSGRIPKVSRRVIIVSDIAFQKSGTSIEVLWNGLSSCRYCFELWNFAASHKLLAGLHWRCRAAWTCETSRWIINDVSWRWRVVSKHDVRVSVCLPLIWR